jgi:Acetyltransferase (GNAT) domain
MCTERRVSSERPPAGYLHRDYAESFSETATPRELQQCGGWILERNIPSSHLIDAMGCYPMFVCRDWSGLPRDLSLLADRLVSLVLVTDPFCEYPDQELRQCFDVVVPFKEHYLTDLRQPIEKSLPRRHRRNLAAARARVSVELCSTPLAMLDDWCRLYGQLVARRGIQGIPAFSRAAFQKQLAVPGVWMFKASEGEDIVGLHLWYVSNDVGYGHLGATSARGHELMASYALYWRAIEQLRDRIRWLDLGAGPGSADDPRAQGLKRFKAGWSTEMRTVHLCGRVFQPGVYQRLVHDHQVGKTSYFPAYRAGEFSSSTALEGDFSRT